MHYGVVGMKWGVRKDRTYGRQLKYSSPARQTAKSTVFQALNTFAASVIPGYGIAYNAWAVAHNARIVRNNLDRTDYTKKEGSYENLSELKKKDVNTTIDDDLKKCNPRIGQQKGTVNNCLYCTAAMEMRQRGYDVRARKKSNGDAETIYGEWFDNVKIEHPSISRNTNESRKSYVQRSFDNLSSQLEKQGDGARGYVGFNYEKTNSGHSIYYKVSNGQVTYYDGQSGTKNPDKLFSLADPRSYSYARLDNLQVKEGITNAVISNTKK